MSEPFDIERLRLPPEPFDQPRPEIDLESLRLTPENAEKLFGRPRTVYTPEQLRLTDDHVRVPLPTPYSLEEVRNVLDQAHAANPDAGPLTAELEDDGVCIRQTPAAKWPMKKRDKTLTELVSSGGIITISRPGWTGQTRDLAGRNYGLGCVIVYQPWAGAPPLHTIVGFSVIDGMANLLDGLDKAYAKRHPPAAAATAPSAP